MIPIFFLLITSTNSLAALECTPLILLHESIKFCENNPSYLPPAKACRDRYKNLVESRKPVIQKILTGHLQSSDAKGHAQNKDLGTSQNIYTSARNMLTDLINRGNQVYAELGAYGDDFVPPIPSWAPGYFKPNRKDKNDPARSLNFYCYAEPMANLDLVLEDVEKIVKSLEKTRAEVIALNNSANIKETNVGKITDDSIGNAPVGGSAIRQVVPENPGIRNSDITGIQEDMASEKNASKSTSGIKGPSSNSVKFNESKKVSPPPKEKLGKKTNTQNTSPKSPVNTHSQPDPATSNRLPTPAVSNAQKNSVSEHSSVGSLIWSEPKDTDAISTDLKINVETDKGIKLENAPSTTSLDEAPSLKKQP